MENRMPNFMKNALNSGLIFGIILVIIQLLFWMFNFIPVGIGPGLLVLLLNLVISVAALVIFTKMYRDKEMGGFMTYGQAFRYGWVVYMVAAVIGVIYSIIFNEFIDPEYMDRVMQLTMDSTESTMRNRGMSEEQISQMLDRMAERTKDAGIGRTIIGGLVGGVIMGVIGSAISSAFAKKEANPLK